MKKKKQIVIAVDPGFDGSKIVVNKQVFNVPFVVQDITADVQNYSLQRRGENFISCNFEGKTYIVGEVARTFILNKSQQEKRKASMEEFYTIGRFKTKLFEVGLNTFIAYALLKYSEYTQKNDETETFLLDEIDNWDIHVGTALPHSYLDELIPEIKSLLMDKPHHFTMTVGSRENMEISFSLKNVFFNSQLVCALLNALVDENGKETTISTGSKDISVYDYLPAVVIDAGYKTLADCLFGRDDSINGGQSDQDYAMMNVNDRVAEIINEKKAGIYGYMIEEYCKNNEVIRYIDENDSIGEINVVKEKEKVLKEVSDKYVSHMLKKYDDLLDTKMILVAGGTGKAYFPYIKEFLKNQRPYLADTTVLSKCTFDGKEYGPVFAVAAGMYKDIIMQLEAEE